ncbi:hypothetical protein VP14_039 [Vibrio phage VPMCC14]|nr:hypothetical protein VP14_039 [Vibrio phage VPMCC14]
MRYSEVEKWVTNNFLDVTVHTSSEGSDVGNKVTVDWTGYKNYASYLTATIDDVDVHKIIIWDFDNEDEKVLALLHELGHHTEDQNGDVVYKEKMAWEGCFKWMEHLGIELNKGLLHTASVWFSSYLDVYGITDSISNWMKSVGLSYKEKQYNLNLFDDGNITIQDFSNHPVFSIDINFEYKITEPKKTNNPKTYPVWGYESWKKRY